MWKAAGPVVDVRGPLDRIVAYNSADRGLYRTYYCFLRVMRDSLEQRVLSQFKRVPLKARFARLARGGGTAAQCVASRRGTQTNE